MVMVLTLSGEKSEQRNEFQVHAQIIDIWMKLLFYVSAQ